MKTRVDTFLRTGYAHYICEDYVLSGTDPVPHIILADGCSSSQMTDTGARILVLTARQSILEAFEQTAAVDIRALERRIIESAGQTARNIGLPPTALDATLMIGYVTGGAVHVHIYGDGAVILSDPSGNLDIVEISYSNNAPYYLSYLLDSDRNSGYRNQPPEKRSGGEMVPWDTPVSMTFSVSDYPLVMLTSDGAASFTDNTGNPVPVPDIAREFSRFKTVRGEFLKRRLKRAFKNFGRNGVRCHDDLSAGAFLTPAGFMEQPSGKEL